MSAQGKPGRRVLGFDTLGEFSKIYSDGYHEEDEEEDLIDFMSDMKINLQSRKAVNNAFDVKGKFIVFVREAQTDAFKAEDAEKRKYPEIRRWKTSQRQTSVSMGMSCFGGTETTGSNNLI